MRNMKIILSVNFVFLLFLIISSCSSEDQITNSESYPALKIKTNQPPTIVLFESAADTVSICGTLDFTCQAQDPDNDSLYYEWASFKITNDSSEGDYDVFYNLNRGEFISGGEAAVWQPGKLDGKYLIICNVHDKAGYEVDTSKIVNVNLEGCLSAVTDKIIYNQNEEHITGIIKNELYDVVFFEACGVIEGEIERKVDDNWEFFMGGFMCTGDRTAVISVDFGEEKLFYSRETLNSLPVGVYRKSFKYRFPYDYSHAPPSETIYSNEFEVCK